METLLLNLISYLISLAANETTSAIHKQSKKKWEKMRDDNAFLQKALSYSRDFRSEVARAADELVITRSSLITNPQEESLLKLLKESEFQRVLGDWIMAGDIEEGKESKEHLAEMMETALKSTGASECRIEFFKNKYFAAIEQEVFSIPELAHWRHQLSIQFLREQVAIVKRIAEETVGIYSPDKQDAALRSYCETALKALDIIDLSNLPEGDIHIVSQKLLLRQLYISLRINTETREKSESLDKSLMEFEFRREERRMREAGRTGLHDTDEKILTRSADEETISVGEFLKDARRLVILGDPGGGKTTMLRWLATAYLLRCQEDVALKQLPDTETLPNEHWIPVLIRCRDLCDDDLCRSFTDFVTMHFRKSELQPEESDIIKAVVLNGMARGSVLLLVDGLDEISNPKVRATFCQQLEKTAARYPDAPIVVCSRIVGYRDMPYRMGDTFKHGLIAELTREDKEYFAARWIEVTEQHKTAKDRALHTKELIEALHSSDRIERLTVNPMLLTTLALVKRKVGKLPSRRTKLYAEAVSVLLNWNPLLYSTIDEEEALPQLEFIAYEMCRRGVQQLVEDEILNLLDRVRQEYKNIRPIGNHTSKEFLDLLEARSSIIIKSGGIWTKRKDIGNPVWEFRHLTFQEYLASRALIDGHYPDRDKSKSLAEQVAPLAGLVVEAKNMYGSDSSKESKELEVTESWREAIRLCVAGCKDDDVDSVLMAVLIPMSDEDSKKTCRPRAVLSAMCLADEPNISEETARTVLELFVENIQNIDTIFHSSLVSAALDVYKSIWRQMLKNSFIDEYYIQKDELRNDICNLWGIIEFSSEIRTEKEENRILFENIVKRFNSGNITEIVSAAMFVLEAAFKGSAYIVPGLIESLFRILDGDYPACYVAVWALGWLAERTQLVEGKISKWIPNTNEVYKLIKTLKRCPDNESDTIRWLALILRNTSDPRAIEPLIEKIGVVEANANQVVIEAIGKIGNSHAVDLLIGKLDDKNVRVRQAAIETLGILRDQRTSELLIAIIEDKNAKVRQAVVEALERLGDPRAVEPLIARIDDEVVDIRVAVIKALGKLEDQRAVEPLIARIDDEVVDIRVAVIKALGKLEDQRAIEPLKKRIEDEDRKVRKAVIGAWMRLTKRDEIDLFLLSRDIDGRDPWLDPETEIDDSFVAAAVKKLKMNPNDIKIRYENLANILNLRLSWKQARN